MVVRTLFGGDDDDDGLILQILVRLPIKSILRFKTVSKSWCSLIQTPSFIHLHTTFKSSSSQFGSFIFLVTFNKYIESEAPDFVGRSGRPYVSVHILSENKIVMLSSSECVDSSLSGSCLWSTTTGSSCSTTKNHDDAAAATDKKLVFKVDTLGFSDYNNFFSNTAIVGSCNGLLCLHHVRLDDVRLEEIYLWNPAIRQFKILPKPIEIAGEFPPKHLVGFGFDVETKDYKVVRLTTTFRSKYYRRASPPIDCRCRIQVYSSSTDSWTLLEGITCLPGYPFSPSYPITTEVVCHNGSCFFLANFFRNKEQLCFPENDRFLISFNLTSYVISPIQLPDHHRHQNLYLRCLGDDKIALFTVGSKLPPRGDYHFPDVYIIRSPPPKYPKIYQPPSGMFYSQICCGENYNVWVLDEHVSSSSSVNKESWRQLHSFQIEHQTPDQWSLPTCISNDGEFLLLGTTTYSIGLGKDMYLYNLATKEMTKDFLSCVQAMAKAYAYQPSLVKCWAAASSRCSDWKW